MNKRMLSKNKTSPTPPQPSQSSSPLLHQRPLTEDLSESIGSNSNISKELGGIQPKTIRRRLNWQNITVEAPSRLGASNTYLGENQRLETFDVKEQEESKKSFQMQPEEAIQSKSSEGEPQGKKEGAERGGKETSDNAAKKAVELPAAITQAKAITKTNDAIDTPVPALLRVLNDSVKSRYPWIKRFEARPKGTLAHYSVHMIASDHEIDPDYTDRNSEKAVSNKAEKFRSDEAAAFLNKVEKLSPEEAAAFLNKINSMTPDLVTAFLNKVDKLNPSEAINLLKKVEGLLSDEVARLVNKVPQNTGWVLPKEGGGARIGNRLYSEHALERMAPRNFQVMAELEARALKRSEVKGLTVGTPEFKAWWDKNGPDPRGIPPSVIEAEIANSGSTGLKVITNNYGVVVTVVPNK